MKKVVFAVLALVFAIWCLWGVFIGATIVYDYCFDAASIYGFPKELICWVSVFPVYAICFERAVTYTECQKHTKPRR